MDPVAPLFALIPFLTALATVFFLVRKYGAPASEGRFVSIDGLRGYLAFAVFLHHACIWYFFLRTKEWMLPPSYLYAYFGQASVAMFFMVTGFLFFSKLIDGRKNGIDWLKLYVSRFLRLVPLYIGAICLLMLIVVALSHGELRNSPIAIAKQIACWLSFTMPGMPDINGIQQTFIITAGVNWSLPYEWLFYFTLPVFAIAVGVKTPLPSIIVGAITIYLITKLNLLIYPLLSFLSGIFAAFIARSPRICRLATTPAASLTVIVCVVIAVNSYSSISEPASILLFSLAFILIACGNDLFGILTTAISRALGQMAYSIYMLHGMLLFVTFIFAVGWKNASTFSPLTHWLLIAGLAPILILICFNTFRHIEYPAMKKASAITAWLRSLRVPPRTSDSSHP